MKTIQVMEPANENFRKYGEFYDIIHPAGNHLGDFYPDHVLVPYDAADRVKIEYNCGK